MSQVKISCGTSPNSLRWRLGEFGEHAFDDLFFDLLTKELKQQDPNVRLLKTPRVEDHGRDIEIFTDMVLRFAGVSIHPPSATEHRILVEVKTLTTASKPRLPLSSFGKNYLQVRELAYSHFVLVTNGSISPRSAREASESFSAAGKQFVLIDEYPLWVLLNNHGVTDRLPERRPLKPTELVVEAQIERTAHDEEIALDIDLMLRNYSNVPRRVTIENLSDLTWRQSVPEVTRTIDPGRFETLHLLAKSKQRDVGDLELLIHDQDGTEYPIRFEAQDIAFDFKPPLVGERHHFCLNELTKALEAEVPSRLINVVGGAGRGKTRLIEESLTRTARATRKVVPAVLDPDRPDLAIKVVLDRLRAELGELPSKNGEPQPNPNSPPTSQLAELLPKLDHPFYSVVILLEDLHHASDAMCSLIRDFLRIDRSARCPLTIIIAGRDDYSFPNDAYFALLDVLTHITAEASSSQACPVTTVHIPDLTREDSRYLIQAIVREAPSYAIERLETIGENVPFFIVQAIEFMLETGIAVLLSRETVGIPNPAVFGTRAGFPAAMKSILRGRIDALEALPEGSHLRQFLEVSSFFGQILPPDLELALLGDVSADRAETLLVGRRFLKRVDDGSLRWYHENILHLLQELVHDAGRAVSLTQNITSKPTLFKHFTGWRAGRILSEAGRHEDAWPYFTSISALAEGMTNISSVNMDSTCFDFIDPAFESAVACGEPPSRLIGLLILQSYIAVHHRSGRHGPETAARALSRLPRIPAGETELLEAHAKLTELRAHGMMDTGNLGPATKLFLELEGAVKQPASVLRQPDLLFDLYNRLQDVYRMHNHLAVCEQYGELADIAARASGGELQTVSMFDSALAYHYIDTPRCIRLHEEALLFAREFGAKRHIAHGEVGLIVASIGPARADVERLKDLMTLTTEILRNALDQSFGALLARIYLMLATLAYLLAGHGVTSWSAVNKYIELSINAAITYNAGSDAWMIYNLKAITALRTGRPVREASAYFSTALQLLRRSALLFLGNLDLTFENIIVLSNVLRFLSDHGTEREKFSLALEIRYYDDVDTRAQRDLTSNAAWARARFSQFEEDVRKNRIFGQTSVPDSVIFDHEAGYAICVAC
ncbi:MAG: ATP-binding protein [Acidobacteriota bacterium]